ncbi:acetyl-CoA carboxylase biotin carboxyl carrier protein [Agrobacterium rhizogenes]|uniref:Biotin carboxyl carrier protein of acetyl-CoA carboxylase n=1 Tax=Rhizobium rhizogenes (strain K84 / ATCC BAA-868) TaxID=311403 RepID=B9JN34_RHIR8|nr:acetyl-CoA carboxylase biotin carboxyl carrier protein [Rhizobium rhizogenes]ACM28965.1 acetyl-CoA carboxylase, biotin carboxyl carrier protein [Rhizobium rhizogenes K84]KAA6486254.1 acetyl-CoA carboxylase biotin carboxyl carrier protein [Agrobacterium sp. ICMP 7243]KEA03511.1 acetyl-CoA carboxylase [Rhizobium rhizogenes]MDJ1634190.1 acetyl-CoA carboxylase biotin carboxyl carrier protein [Rhizobium rhizogenes]MQB32889.1 acetyl-CoA carboxylase biotin carboxyl carrier protein [Rhizobium rhizo
MDLQKIKTLIEFVGRSQISELVVSQDGTTVRISNGISRQATAAEDSAVVRQQPARSPVVKDAVSPEGGKADQMVVAPVFGLLHRSPSPGAPPFVKVGDVVEAGQGLCIIEAMKVFNTVSAHKTGPIMRILADDGQEVDAGQPLMEIG